MSSSTKRSFIEVRKQIVSLYATDCFLQTHRPFSEHFAPIIASQSNDFLQGLFNTPIKLSELSLNVLLAI